MNFLFAISTTVGMTLIPLLITDGLGMSLFILGLIEGGAELLSNILRLITGNLFDRIKGKKFLFTIPAILAFIAKILLFVPNVFTIISSKLIERIANGSFAVPRDAYVAKNATNKGLALGILNSAKTLGCVLGPIVVSITSLVLIPLKDNIFYIILLVCLINFLIVVVSFYINTDKKIELKNEPIFNFNELKLVCKKLKFLFILSLLFFFGRFNDGIIMLFLKKNNYPEWFYLSTISFFNFVMLLVSPIMGYQIDNNKEYKILFITIIALLMFNMFSLQLDTLGWFGACIALICWGIQRAGAQITFSTMIFKRTPKKFYGTAIGIYSLVTGIGVFISSSISGYLAEHNFNHVFMFSSFFACMSLIFATYMCLNDKVLTKKAY